MDVAINTNYRLYILGDNMPLSCTVESINDDGEVVFRGLLPEARRLIKPLIEFRIEDSEGKEIFLAKVLKSNWKSVDDVVARRSDEATTVILSAEILCEIKHCQFFEPL